MLQFTDISAQTVIEQNNIKTLSLPIGNFSKIGVEILQLVVRKVSHQRISDHKGGIDHEKDESDAHDYSDHR